MFTEPIGTLKTQAQLYVRANPVCPRHRGNILSRVNRFCDYMQSPLPIAELNAAAVNNFLLWLEDSGRSPATTNGYRAAIMCVWSFALNERLVCKIRRAKCREKHIEAWNLDEIRQLLALAKTLPKCLPNGVPESVYWRCAVHSGYSTGLRYGDLASVETKSILPDRTLTICQSKTGKLVPVRFSMQAMELIREHGKAEVLPTPYTQKWFCCRFSQIVALARVRPGTFKWLRRSCGSYCEKENGRGPEALGNTRQIFDRSYGADEILRRPPPEPPEL